MEYRAQRFLPVKVNKEHPAEGYTHEEMIVLASLRRKTGRTCKTCEWYSARGSNRGCFPDGKYRKWLSPEEFSSGCDMFLKRKG